MSGIGRVARRTWKRKDGTIVESRYYSIYYPHNGYTRREKTTATTEASARAILTQRIKQGDLVGSGRIPTMREASTAWLKGKTLSESKRGGPIKESTLYYWRNLIVKYIIPVLGDERLDRIDTRVVEMARDIWRGDGVSPQVVNKVLVTLGAIFKKQMALGAVRFNPVTVAERLATGSNEVTEDGSDIDSLGIQKEQVYSPDELRRLIEATERGYPRTLLLTLACTMARHGEVLGLMWSDVDFEEKTIAIRRSWSQRYRDGEPIFWIPKTKHSIRVIKIPAVLVLALKIWKLQCPPSRWDLIFPTDEGHLSYRKKTMLIMQAAIKKAGLRHLTVHYLRHTGASIHLMSGTPPPEVSAMLGHASTAVTMSVYAHFVPRMATDSAEKLAGLIFGKPEGPETADRDAWGKPGP